MVENENRIGWSQMLGMLVCLAWLFPPAINVAIGQESTFIQLNPPAEGAPPSPGRGTQSNETEPVATVAESVTTAEIGATAEISEEIDLGEDVGEEPTAPAASQQAVSEPSGQVELSVEPGARQPMPGSKPLLPENRPAWVGADPDYSGKNHRLFVGSLPMAKQSEADRGLAEPMMAAVNAYLDDHLLGSDGAAQQLEIDDNFIRKNLINDPIGYMAEISTSDGPMYQKWVTLEITPTQQKQLKRMHQEAVQLQRVKPLALGLAGLLGLVSLAHVAVKRKKGVASITPLDGEQLAAVERPSQHMPPPGKRSSGFGLLVLAAMFMVPLGLAVLFLGSFSVTRVQVEPPAPISEVLTSDILPPATPGTPAPPSADELLQTLQNSDEKVIIHESEGGQTITIRYR